MTRKDYWKFTEMFKEQAGPMEEARFCNAGAERRQWIKRVADIFQEDNPRFNRQRFYEACGLEE